MKISVIIPAFNGEKYIAQCIENVLYQTYKEIEIIVVNDGSTDRTAEIAARWPEVKLINQENQGLSVARNSGMEVATGDYIHFMDADDLINRNYYERMVDAITGVESVDMVFGGFVNGIHPELSLSFADRLLITLLEDKIALTNAGLMGYAVRYLVRRKFLEENNLRFEPGRLIEDVPFTLEAIAWSKAVATAPGATYYYIKRAGSILNSRNRERARKRALDYSYARAWRREFYERNGLGTVVKPRITCVYKLFGIPVSTKIVRNDGKTRWYLFGVRILQRRVKV